MKLRLNIHVDLILPPLQTHTGAGRSDYHGVFAMSHLPRLVGRITSVINTDKYFSVRQKIRHYIHDRQMTNTIA